MCKITQITENTNCYNFNYLLFLISVVPACVVAVCNHKIFPNLPVIKNTHSSFSPMAAHINQMMGKDSQYRTNDSRSENSPLQIFVKAKKKINDIFLEIDDYVDDTIRFIGCKLKFVNPLSFLLS